MQPTRLLTPPPVDLPSGLRVMIVDDEESNRLLLGRVLTASKSFKELCWEVKEARDGTEALEMYQAAEFDVIFIDTNMGDGPTGQEVTQAIRSGYAGIPIQTQPLIVGVSGNCTDHDIQLSSDSGQDALIPKPLPRHANLAQKIASLLAGKRVCDI
eukprot:NODE_3298_length_790_cov_67.941970_g2755_i0.p1 GENE.NODE_3298_length_790_cov_67.941970_g2755_i0~~NODE_3298_length_790_cov_67.941970_g2755_i0.p1  ORF type:complete len:156 (-),score=35.40 NODE_3298_length_790_cov_67.941970_g2755_i0:142-609(-)